MSKGIYRIYNTRNGKSYIGRSINIESRIRTHFSQLERGVHRNKKLQQDYSPESFSWEILKETEYENMVIEEELFIDKFNAYYSGYNNVPTGKNGKQAQEPKTRRSICFDPDLDKQMVLYCRKYSLTYNSFINMVISRYLRAEKEKCSSAQISNKI